MGVLGSNGRPVEESTNMLCAMIKLENGGIARVAVAALLPGDQVVQTILQQLSELNAKVDRLLEPSLSPKETQAIERAEMALGKFAEKILEETKE